MRVVFLGTSDFAVPTLKALAASSHAPSLVVTQPDRPSGRGRKLQQSPVKEAALALGIPVFQPERVNTPEARAEISRHQPDVIVLVSFGQILKPKLLNLPPHGCLNIHGSLLPRHRGASPVQATLLAGDDEAGVTLMRMDPGLDTGPIALAASTRVEAGETAAHLHDRLALLGAELAVRGLDALAAGRLEFLPQPEVGVTHCGLIDKKDGAIDFELDAVAVDRHIRAMTTWPGAQADLVRASAPLRVTIEAASIDRSDRSGTPGTILEVSKAGLVVACGRGALRILALKPQGKRSMPVADFLNGYPVAVGDRLLKPASNEAPESA